MATITEIAGTKQQKKILRTAAYCRVSSDSLAVLENEITELLNSVIQNPDLAGKEYISSKNETPIEIKRMENEIERALGQIDFDKEKNKDVNASSDNA